MVGLWRTPCSRQRGAAIAPCAQAPLIGDPTETFTWQNDLNLEHSISINNTTGSRKVLVARVTPAFTDLSDFMVND